MKVKSESEVAQLCLTLSDPSGLQPTRLFHPGEFPGKSTGMGCHCLRVLVSAVQIVNQPCVYIYPVLLKPPSYPHLTPLNHHRALSCTLVLCSRSLLASCFTHGSIGEGNGTPPRYSCLENPRDGGACWAAVYGVTPSQTRLK